MATENGFFAYFCLSRKGLEHVRKALLVIRVLVIEARKLLWLLGRLRWKLMLSRLYCGLSCSLDFGLDLCLCLCLCLCFRLSLGSFSFC